MHSKREFRLVFCLEVARIFREVGFDAMRQVLDQEMEEKRLDFLGNRPTLMISERSSWVDNLRTFY